MLIFFFQYRCILPDIGLTDVVDLCLLVYRGFSVHIENGVAVVLQVLKI